ncbi:U3 small nucleolar RNA-associated protein 11 [Geosmithia morbida]|uniref:U3 small nucleolar RNA-associated protein 11 n=1 Tax=Geosmithia morbida TaxID=1094350 RepID=A0A9P4YXW0_9HYPO|nr:U3 small nucleolar RNA-associated protein 11 [Geosmithia morbida]KAF4124875.1 U3 small nucleolar RNA-associated protein 11 [Geosmithia morbida]
MSSMRNAVQRRPHRERAQPHERRRLGLLEKHKDYSLRAKDYNKKKEQLKALHQKAAERNEDEFYFGMMSRKGPGSRIKDGRTWDGKIHGDRGNSAMDMDTVRLLKTQDMGYIRTMRQVAMKEVARLEQQVVLTRSLDRLDDEEEEEEAAEDGDMFGMPSKPKPARKTVFFDDVDERDDVLDSMDGDDESGKKAKEARMAEEGEANDQDKDAERLQRRLQNARRRLAVLTNAEEQLNIQQAKMAKTATSGGETKKGDRIKVRARKR